ncbi:MAG: nitroreductase family protein [Parachlamydiaceae bacterium]
MSEETLTEVISERKSGKNFDPAKKITDQQIKDLIHAAHNAPSCYNEQPWRFLICNKATHNDAFQKVFSSLAEANQKWAGNASALIVVSASTKFARNGKDNRWGPYDTGAAAILMALKATELGLLTHQMGGFDEKKIATDFQIPEGYTPYAVMAVGYSAAPEDLPRNRNPIATQFFDGKWGHGF